MGLIMEVPKIYLDTKHLINIARLRNQSGVVPADQQAAYKLIDEYIRDLHFGIIFNIAAPLDWVNGQATLDHANEIADIVDSAKLQYELDVDTFVYLHEVLKELKRQRVSLSVPNFEVFSVRSPELRVERPIPALLRDVPSFFNDDKLLPGSDQLRGKSIGFGSIRDYVGRAWALKEERPNVFQERINGFRAATRQDLDILNARENKTILRTDKIDWIKRRLKVDRILVSLNPEVDIDQVLGGIVLDNCPATSLYLKMHELRLRNVGQRIKDNDVDDWLYVPVISYADVVLTERNLAGYVKQADPVIAARVTDNPNDAVRLLQKWAPSCVCAAGR